MAIDGKIKAMRVDGQNLILELEPRITPDGYPTLTGQDELTILDFQFTPEVGDEVWGGSGRVHIERINRRPTLHYRRVETTKLREDHDYGLCSSSSRRFA